jgi:hypothetical protein
MAADNSIDPKKVLRDAKKILLIDWPNPTVPRKLLNAGFTVFCYSPGLYSVAELATEYPPDVNQKNIFPGNKDEGYLIFRPLADAPDSVNIVNIYRPENEHPDIITKHVLPLHAKVLWLQSASSEKTRLLAEEQELIFIEGYDIAEIASSV